MLGAPPCYRCIGSSDSFSCARRCELDSLLRLSRVLPSTLLLVYSIDMQRCIDTLVIDIEVVC